MNDARVLVVDDSAAMRALFSDLLDGARNVEVVGTAADAAEARDMIARLHPNVITLDVEMPGMSGIEFLGEIMTTKPLPVVMLSSLTQAGTETSLKAYELGAVECFPKPLRATPEQFAKSVGKLGKIVLAAANSNLKTRRAPRPEAREQGASFEWNGRYVAIGTSMGGIDALTSLLAHYPAACPPTVITLGAELALVETFIERMAADAPFTIKLARDGAQLVPGTVHIAADPARHVVFEPGQPACIRLIEREPVDGARPSATLLFGTLARAGLPSIGAVLTGLGSDGARGLKLMRDAGARTFAEDPASATVSQAPDAAIAAGGAEQTLEIEALARSLIGACSTDPDYSAG